MSMALGKKGIGTGGAIAIVFIVGLLFVCCFVDLITCPTCRNVPIVKYACPTCGGDGKITVLQYIPLMLQGGSITNQLKVLEVSGMGVTTTVDCDEPFRLEVSGMNCVVTVSRGAPLKELDVSGMDSIVYIPEEMTPEIDISGMNSEVIRY